MPPAHRQRDEDPEVHDLLQYLSDIQITGRTGFDLRDIDDFIPHPKIIIYFQNNLKLERLLAALERTGTPAVAHNFVSKRCLRVLCILVRIGMGHFIRYFTGNAALHDDSLPFVTRPVGFPTSSGVPEDFFDRFQRAQWAFCARELEFTMDTTLGTHEILPFTEFVRYKNGGNAVIYKVCIHESYDDLRKREEASVASDHTYALKVYEASNENARSDYEAEMTAFNRLGRETMTTSNVIGCYGGFCYKENYCLLLDFACKGSLEDYLQTNDPPEEAEEITNFWESLLEGLSGGLVELHTSGNSYGWHQDIKPANILIVGTASCDALSFKLADFGLSHFASPVRNGELQEAIGPDSEGTLEYGAPECTSRSDTTFRSTMMVTPKVDVWSMGCVLSEVATWMVSSARGINSYRERRRDATSSMLHLRWKWCFHDGTEVLEMVQRQHQTVKRRTRGLDCITSGIVDNLISPALKSVPESRPTAREIWNKARDLLCTARIQAQRNVGVPRTPDLNTGQWSQQFNAEPITPETYMQNNQFPGNLPSPDSAPQLRQHSQFGQPYHPARLYSQPSSATSPASQNSLPQMMEGVYRDSSREDVQNSTTLSNEGPIPSTISPSPRPGPSFISTGSSSVPPSTPESLPFLSLRDAKQSMKQQRCTFSKLDTRGLLKTLANRDHVFLLDDSCTMRDHFQAMRDLCLFLFDIVAGFDPNGVDIFFTTSDMEKKNVKEKYRLQTLLNRAQSQNGPCNLSAKLGAILHEYQERILKDYDGSFLQRWKKKPRQLSVYVLTDGRWQAGTDPDGHINNLVDVMEKTNQRIEQVGIQFIRFGNNEDALRRLEKLDDGLGKQRDIVDTVAADGNVFKMVLGGGVHRGYD